MFDDDDEPFVINGIGLCIVWGEDGVRGESIAMAAIEYICNAADIIVVSSFDVVLALRLIFLEAVMSKWAN